METQVRNTLTLPPRRRHVAGDIFTTTQYPVIFRWSQAGVPLPRDACFHSAMQADHILI